MTSFLFLQRFDNGEAAPIPYDDVMSLLRRHGTARHWPLDTEVTFGPDTIAPSCTVIGDAASGVACIAFERPRYDAALRALAWECIERFGCTVFDGTLLGVGTPPGRLDALPPPLRAACAAGARQIASIGQLWSHDTAPGAVAAAPALHYRNPNGTGRGMQLFDWIDSDAHQVGLVIGMRPQACNSATLRVLRNLELRVDAALGANPAYRCEYRHACIEVARLLKSSPAPGVLKHSDSIDHPSWSETAPSAGFVMNRALSARAGAEAGRLATQVRERYNMTLDLSAASIDLLAPLLDKVHALVRRERASHAADMPYVSALAASWAARAGSYLGAVIARCIGAQWGYCLHGAPSEPALRTHRGGICFPHLLVLDHIVNGASDNLAQRMRQLTLIHASNTARADDVAANVPALCQMLLTRLPHAPLDFSLASLRHVDAYLAQRGAIAAQDEARMVMACGAYLGEVVRTNAAAPDAWQWTNYDDAAALHPRFAQQQPREAGARGLLDSAAGMAFPLAQAALALAGQGKLRAYARQLIHGDDTPVLGPDEINDWPGDPVMAGALDEVRAALVRWRGVANKDDFEVLRGADPGWLAADPLGVILEGQLDLLAEGTVVWGAMVQANTLLFAPGLDDCPGDLLYSRDPHFDSRPQALKRIARAVSAHKSETAAGAFRIIGRNLAAETVRSFDLPVPDLLTDQEVLMSSYMMFRKHLPGRILGGGGFPVLIHHEVRAVMIVPDWFWPPHLLKMWNTGQFS
ncbi:hypothetical protein INH39_06190 [Massilia violaceinigra]|uniref:Uncharacterized protein n=1 Tax=Massilia violaceinigra TaxID=2045208 RepID=A0ABY4ACJ8_9BURK|nr:hypothetical protein [Massilia violaceinigra]UOD31301.1 hypothetical protein INH39_06190 [Massilia violaceinigra]